MKGARHLSKEEIQSLAQSFYGEYETRNRTLFLLGLNIGTRISELLALNVGDVWQYGKPVAILELKKAITKEKKTRQIPLNEQAKEVITELIKWKKSHGEDLSPNAPFFASRKGNDGYKNGYSLVTIDNFKSGFNTPKFRELVTRNGSLLICFGLSTSRLL